MPTRLRLFGGPRVTSTFRRGTIQHVTVRRGAVGHRLTAARAVAAWGWLALASLGMTSCTPSTTPPTPAATASTSSSTGGSAEPGRVVSWPLALQPQSIDAGAASAQPQITMSPRGAIVSWLDAADGLATLRFTERTASGWSAPRTVASGRDWFVSWADVPSVLRLRDGTLVAQWLKSVDPDTEAYDIKMATSRDDGKTWTRPFSPHADGTRTQHGFVSLFEWPAGANDGGDLGLVWLDGRDEQLKANEPEGGSMGLRYARLNVSAPTRTPAPPVDAVVNDRVCECCPTSVAITEGGPIAAFRDRSPTEIRDIHTTRFENGAWTAPQLVHADNWQIESCPVNGPAVSARASRVAVAWFTVKDDVGHAYVAFSTDSGRTWGEAIRVDEAASRGQVDVELLDDGAAAVTWIEFVDQRSGLRVRRIDPSGARSAAVAIAAPVQAPQTESGRVSGIPRMARMGNDLVFAWAESRSGGEEDVSVKGAVARIPPVGAP